VKKKAVISYKGLCPVRVIPLQFRKLMKNLIGNSLKFSKPGNPPEISINGEIKKGAHLSKNLVPYKKYFHISIHDNGIGFEPQYSERIFEVFQRLHTKDEYSGSGIGLAICKQIVKNHNGMISATGTLREGACFDLFIPVS
jgi:light-regulated signal transduction histidine kinase (bacteriophytochrome)